MSKREDLTGKKFGIYRIIKRTKSVFDGSGGLRSRYACKCLRCGHTDFFTHKNIRQRKFAPIGCNMCHQDYLDSGEKLFFNRPLNRLCTKGRKAMYKEQSKTLTGAYK